MTHTQDIWVVDAFTAAPFKGNPAAVCVMDAFPNDDIMQQIAMEMSMSETAFLVENAPLDYNLRWFTPTVEVSLCGHATLAATHVLREMGKIEGDAKVKYRTLSGMLQASVKGDTITIDLPELAGDPASIPLALMQALKTRILSCERSVENYLVEVEDLKTLKACEPNLAVIAGLDAQGVIVTTANGCGEYDFASRYFAPQVGIDEDPVTGSAHCMLAPYWAKRLKKTEMRALQASKREGVLQVTLANGRVLIGGRAITTLKGQIFLPESKMNEQPQLEEHAA